MVTSTNLLPINNNNNNNKQKGIVVGASVLTIGMWEILCRFSERNINED